MYRPLACQDSRQVGGSLFSGRSPNSCHVQRQVPGPSVSNGPHAKPACCRIRSDSSRGKHSPRTHRCRAETHQYNERGEKDNYTNSDKLIENTKKEETER